jgi:hypothetical protein
MRTRSLVLTGTVVLVLGACATVGLRRGGVNIDDAYIEIRPGTQISADDQKELAKVLNKYEKKIYWVENINNVAERGELSCVFVDNTLLNELLQSYSAGTSYSAIQIGARPTKGNCDIVHHTPNPHTSSLHHTPFLHHTPNPHSQLSQADYYKSRALVKEVTPILQKYTHE